MKVLLSLLVAVAICGAALFAVVKVKGVRMTPEQLAAEEVRYQVEKQAEEARIKAEHLQAVRRNNALREKQEKAGELQRPYLEELVAIEGVARAEFIDLNHLRLRLKPLMHIGQDHVRVMCENVAKGWAARSGMTPVVCEEWYGEKLYATGEYNGPVPEAYLVKLVGEAIQKQQTQDADAKAAMAGKTFAEIEATHGKALSKSAETGWAEFQKFRARFENGKVAEVSVK